MIDKLRTENGMLAMQLNELNKNKGKSAKKGSGSSSLTITSFSDDCILGHKFSLSNKNVVPEIDESKIQQLKENRYKAFLKKISKNGKLLHTVFYDWHLDIRAGGPTGYLANLLLGINRALPSRSEELPDVYFATRKKKKTIPVQRGIRGRVLDFFKKSSLFNYFWINYLSKSSKSELKSFINFLRKPEEMTPSEEVLKQLNLSKLKTVHVHTIFDAIKIKNFLVKNGKTNVVILLTSHTPESVALEFRQSYLDAGYTEHTAETIYRLVQNVEKRAFSQADVLVFPSYESMAPARENIDDFDAILSHKEVRFVETGVKPIVPSCGKIEAKRYYGVEGKKVIGFLGRHNSIKGYDILKQVARSVLEKHADVVFLIGGDQGKEFTPLNNPRWIECGRVDPAKFLPAIDIFVLPNRQTYFDLVFLEVMSMGIPIVASHTGGNITMAKENPHVVTYLDEEKGLELAIESMLSQSKEELDEIGESLRKSYESKYTLDVFAENYLNMVADIQKKYFGDHK